MYTGTATSATAHATANAIATALRLVPSSLRSTGRATIIRSTKRPIADITERKTSQRITSSGVVVAVAEIFGIVNSGSTPCPGPTANVNTPETGWPSTEITRQITRYQPLSRCLSGTTSV